MSTTPTAPVATATLDSIGSAARRLRDAAAQQRPCPPVRDLIGSADLAAAYAVQSENVRHRIREGALIVGRKIGLTSPAVQQQLGVDQPDLGVLFADMAHDDGAVLPADAVLQPRVEAEVAFVLGADLRDVDLDADKVRAAVDHVVAALEVCGSRIAGWDITFGDTVADNASAGAFVLGTQRRTLAEIEPRDVTMRMRIDAREVSTGTGAACLGDPINALVWLARQARDLGQPLLAGQVVLSGALGPMAALTPGSAVAAEISGLGTVTMSLGDTNEGQA